ncbi:MAG: HDOD domain-containing protein, partial [Gammaproteobacteria bacterium]|nr:HDOD domain-containing protein [Gammaproteobacteria bacterium]
PDSLEKFANHLEKDPALRLRLLAISQPGNDNTEGSLQALQRLDEHTLNNLAITATTQQYFSGNNSNTQEQNRFLKQHWQHALLCADIARALAEQSGYPSPDEAYAAGLLHDIGQLVLHSAYPDIYSNIYADHDDGSVLHDLENSEFSCNHLHLGAELLRNYQASSFFSDAILYHHEPVERIVDAHPLVRIVHLANRICSTDFNQHDKSAKNDIFDHADQLFGFSRSVVIKTLSDANIYLNDCTVEFEIDLDDEEGDDENARVIRARTEYVQKQLQEQIKYHGLLDGLHQQCARTSNTTELLAAIEQYSRLLFDIEHQLVFLRDTDNTEVRAVSHAGQRHLNELIIPLKENRSIISDCLLRKESLHSFTREYSQLSIVDQQLCSATTSLGMVCLPLISHQQSLGVLVFAVDHAQQESLWKRLALVQHYSREIAHILYYRQTHDEEVGHIDYETHIREVIHEAGNPLSIINNYLEILSLKLGDENRAHADIETIKSEIRRVSDILQRLKTPKNNTGNKTTVDINALISELGTVFETSILANQSIQLKLNLDSELEAISCNADALKQIFTNLVKNAAEALPAKGKIMVYTQGQVNVDGKTFIEISITDNGPGIRAEVLNQLFKPVQSDKGDGHAGIGLSIVRKLVGEMNGSISCRTNNKGTSFQILLPNK